MSQKAFYLVTDRCIQSEGTLSLVQLCQFDAGCREMEPDNLAILTVDGVDIEYHGLSKVGYRDE